MTAPTCPHHDDGRHRWRYGRGHFTGQPAYRCWCGTAVITWPEDDDAAYLVDLGGVPVEPCAGCGVEVEVGDGWDGAYWNLPVGTVALCLDCGPDEAEALAELAAAREVTA